MTADTTSEMNAETASESPHADTQANRIVVSFRSPETDPDENDDWWVADSEWIQDKMTEYSYQRYLRMAHAGPVEIDDEWDEFVNCGCASPEDVILRVEEVDGGTEIGAETTVEVIPRKAVVDDTAAENGASE